MEHSNDDPASIPSSTVVSAPHLMSQVAGLRGKANQVPELAFSSLTSQNEGVGADVLGQFDDSPDDELAKFLNRFHQHKTYGRELHDDALAGNESWQVGTLANIANVAVPAIPGFSSLSTVTSMAPTDTTVSYDISRRGDMESRRPSMKAVWSQNHLETPSVVSSSDSLPPMRRNGLNSPAELTEVGKVISAPFETNGFTTILDADVLCGRGGKSNKHSGNIEFRMLIEQSRQEYFSSRKPRKTEISQNIVDTIRGKGGRFLKYDKKTEKWYDVGDAKAIEKTSQALREGAAQRLRDILLAHTGAPNTPTRESSPERESPCDTPLASTSSEAALIGKQADITEADLSRENDSEMSNGKKRNHNECETKGETEGPVAKRLHI